MTPSRARRRRFWKRLALWLTVVLITTNIAVLVVGVTHGNWFMVVQGACFIGGARVLYGAMTYGL